MYFFMFQYGNTMMLKDFFGCGKVYDLTPLLVKFLGFYSSAFEGSVLLGYGTVTG